MKKSLVYVFVLTCFLGLFAHVQAAKDLYEASEPVIECPPLPTHMSLHYKLSRLCWEKAVGAPHVNPSIAGSGTKGENTPDMIRLIYFQCLGDFYKDQAEELYKLDPDLLGLHLT